ncbi:MAG: helix-turn-helix domain-containing protein [Rubrobacter sp.]|nr:helix-turn-helix domain-containing protein [Rubrobacter sp.]
MSTDREGPTGHVERDGELGIGRTLEALRKERGLSLQDVEEATKIRTRYVEALENEDFDALPDRIYVQGFLKSYATFLGLDGEELVREFRGSATERPVHGPSASGEFERPIRNPGGLSTPARRRATNAIFITLSLAVVFLIALVGVFYFVGREAQLTGDRVEPLPGDAAPATDGAPDEPNPALETTDTTTNETTTSETTDQAEDTSGGSTIGSSGEVEGDSIVTTVSVSDTEVWISVRSDGELAFQGFAQQGFVQSFESQQSLAITSGNAGAVELEVNGQEYGALGDDGEITTRSFTLKSQG